MGKVKDHNESGVGVTLADWNGDGKLDIITVGVESKIKYFENNIPQK